MYALENYNIYLMDIYMTDCIIVENNFIISANISIIIQHDLIIKLKKPRKITIRKKRMIKQK